jgi:anti-sigma regulatory factor (Ser/Thr protein kinase)
MKLSGFAWHAAGNPPRDEPGWEGMGLSGRPRARARWSFAPELSALREARRQVGPLLAAWGLSPDDRDIALLVINELLSNAVEHAGTSVELRLSLTDTALLVRVRDQSPAAPQLRPFDVQARRGRGLQFVEALAERWSWTVDARGKTVWAELIPSATSNRKP